MSSRFVLTAQLNLQAPDVRRVVREIRRDLSGITVDLRVKNIDKIRRDIDKATKSLKKMDKQTKASATGFAKLSKQMGQAIKNVIRYDIARSVITGFTMALRGGVQEAIKFEKELIKVAQVTGKATSNLSELTGEITKIATKFGVSSSSLVKTSRVLAQTGMAAKEVQQALKALALTTIAPTFDDISNTTETTIAMMRQFGIAAKDVQRELGRINAIAGQFAVESADIGVAIRRAGGAFKSAGGQLMELEALFTSVRATTRETAETIATGFRTIFTRMQRPKTIKFLRSMGIELQNLQGHFIGPYQAVQKLHYALKGLDPRDVRYSQIVEQLGGFRQVSKVIPMIQQFEMTQRALNVAMAGGGSLAKDAAKAQEGLGIQFTKVKEEFTALMRELAMSPGFKAMAKTVLALASALISLASALKPVIPLLTMLMVGKGLSMGVGFMGKGLGKMKGMARGGMVPGRGNGDTVPAMLEPGEFVLRKSAVNAIGAGRLAGINRYNRGGRVRMSAGGVPRSFGPLKRFRSQTAQANIQDEKLKSFEKKAGLTFKSREHAFNPNDKIKFKYSKRTTLFKDLLPTKVSGKTLNMATMYTSGGHGKAYEEALKYRKKMMKTGDTGGSQPFDGKIGETFVEAKSVRTVNSSTIREIGDKTLRQSLKGSRKPKMGKMTKDADPGINIGGMSVKFYRDIPTADNKQIVQGRIDKYHADMKHKQLAGKKAAKPGSFATGGVAVGTDTIPALLTPGEFVVNRKSAKAFGYGNLGKLNKYAKGGVVGRQRFAEGGEAAGGGGFMKIMGLTMAIDMIVQMTTTMGGASEKTQEFANKLTSVITGMGVLLMAIQSEAAARIAGQVRGMNIPVVSSAMSGKGLGGRFGAGGGWAGGIIDKKAMKGHKIFGKSMSREAFDKGMEARKLAKADVMRAAGSPMKGTVMHTKAVADASKAGTEAFKKTSGAIMRTTKAARDLAMVMGMAGVALEMYGDHIHEQGKKAIEAGNYEEGRRKMVKGGTAAGAGMGMAIGSILGPFGAAIGGLVGGLYGYWKSVKESAELIERVKFGKQLEHFKNSLKAVTEGKASPMAAAASISTGVKALKDRFNTLANAADVDELQGEIKNAVPALQAYIDKVAQNVTSFAQLENVVGKDTFRTFSQFSKIPVSKLRKQYTEQIALMQKSKIAQAKMLAVMEQQTRTMLMVRDVTNSFAALEAGLLTFDTALDNLSQSMNNNFTVSAGGSMAPAFKNLENIVDFAGFGKRVDALAGMMEPFAGGMAEQVKSAAVIMRDLPAVLLEASNEIGVAGADAGTIIMDKLDEADVGGFLTGSMRRGLEAQIEAFTLGEGGGGKLADMIKKDLDGVIKRLTKGVLTSLKAFQKAAEFFDKSNARLAKAFQLRNQIDQKILNTRIKLEKVEADHAARLRKARGQKADPTAQRDMFQRQQAVRAQAAGVAPGGGMNVQGLSQEFNLLKVRIQASNQQLAQQGLDPAQLAGTQNLLDSQKKLIEQNANLKKQFAATKDALVAFADTASRVAEIERSLAEEKKSREAKRGVVSEFTFGTDENRKQLAQSLNTTFAAAAAGTISYVDEKMRPAVGKILDRFKDVELPGLGGKTGGEVKKEMEIDYLESVFGPLTAAQKKQIFERTTAEEQLIKEMQKVQKDALDAQKALLQGLKDDRHQANQEITQLHENLVNGLERVLTEQNKRQMQRELGQEKSTKQSADKTLAVLTKLQADIGGAGVADLSTGQGMEQFRNMMPAMVKAQEAQAEQARIAASGVHAVYESARKDTSMTSTGFEDVFKPMGRGAQGGLDWDMKDLSHAQDLMEAYITANVKDQEIADAMIMDGKNKMAEAFKAGMDIDDAGVVLEGVFASVAKGQMDQHQKTIDAAHQLAKAQNLTTAQFNNLVTHASQFSTVLKNIPSGANIKDLSDASQTAAGNIQQLDTNIQGANARLGQLGGGGGQVQTLAVGGVAFSPKGTDTVPAMLTPGEFVVNRKSAQANMGTLKAINSGYYADGGLVVKDQNKFYEATSKLTKESISEWNPAEAINAPMQTWFKSLAAEKSGKQTPVPFWWNAGDVKLGFKPGDIPTPNILRIVSHMSKGKLKGGIKQPFAGGLQGWFDMGMPMKNNIVPVGIMSGGNDHNWWRIDQDGRMKGSYPDYDMVKSIQESSHSVDGLWIEADKKHDFGMKLADDETTWKAKETHFTSPGVLLPGVWAQKRFGNQAKVSRFDKMIESFAPLVDMNRYSTGGWNIGPGPDGSNRIFTDKRYMFGSGLQLDGPTGPTTMGDSPWVEMFEQSSGKQFMEKYKKFANDRANYVGTIAANYLAGKKEEGVLAAGDSKLAKTFIDNFIAHIDNMAVKPDFSEPTGYFNLDAHVQGFRRDAGGVGGSELVLPGGFKDPVGKQIDEYFGKLIVDSDSWIKNMKQGHADNLSQLKTISASETPHHFIGHIFDQYGFSEIGKNVEEKRATDKQAKKEEFDDATAARISDANIAIYGANEVGKAFIKKAFGDSAFRRMRLPGYARTNLELNNRQLTLQSALAKRGFWDKGKPAGGDASPAWFTGAIFPTIMNWIDILDKTQQRLGIISASDGKSSFEWDEARVLAKIEEERLENPKAAGGQGSMFSAVNGFIRNITPSMSPFDEKHPFQQGGISGSMKTGGSAEEAFTRAIFSGAAGYYQAVAGASEALTKTVDETYQLTPEGLMKQQKKKAAPTKPTRPKNVLGMAQGGAVSSAMFVPQGTDTVPAMLTPGEYVVRKSAVDALGVEFLDYLNNSNHKSTGRKYSRGGQVQYLQEGGEKTAGGAKLDSSAFDASVKHFSTIVDKLSNITLGGSLTVDGTVNVNVNLNGHEVLAEAKSELGRAAGDKIDGGIISMLKAHFPKIHPKLSYSSPEGPSHPGPP